METASADSLMPIIVALIGSQGLIAGAIALMAFRVGRIPSREESNALRDEVAADKEEISSTRLDLKEDIAATRLDLKEDIAATRLEIFNTKAELRQEISDTKAELRQEISDTKAELRQEISDAKDELRQEITTAKDEVLREIRRSHQQLVLTLVNHTHNANGQAVFTLPPETEPTPADN